MAATEAVSDGRFVFVVRAGRYELYARTPSGAIARRTLSTNASRTTHIDLVFEVYEL